jgi:hypothetical protein
VAGRTFSWPFSTRDTVATETPACSATPAIEMPSAAPRNGLTPGWGCAADTADGALVDDDLDK